MTPLIGHAEALERMRRTIARGRLASTYLIVGPAGIGRRTFATHVASALLCEADEREDPATPCGRCGGCTMSAAGTHPDLLRVRKPENKSGVPIDLLIGPPDKRNREGLCHDVALRPFRGRRRVAILEDADDLGVEAANSLLKTLEEPPPGSVLLLVGTSVAKQLPTIRSRAQVIRLAPLANEEVTQVLGAQGIDPVEAEQLAATSGGSVTRALASQDTTLGEAADAMRNCLAVPTIDAVRLAATLEEQSKAAGTEPRERRRLMGEMLAAAVTVYRERIAERVAAGHSADAELAALDACFDAEEAIGRNANQGAVIQRLAERLGARLGERLGDPARA